MPRKTKWVQMAVCYNNCHFELKFQSAILLSERPLLLFTILRSVKSFRILAGSRPPLQSHHISEYPVHKAVNSHPYSVPESVGNESIFLRMT